MAAPPAPATATGASLYVGDLHLDVTDGQLFDFFSEFKSLTSVRVCRDSATNRSLGYGYVNFLSPQDAVHAIEVKNYSTLNGKVVRVMWSHRDSDARRSGVGNVFVKNLCLSIDTLKLKEMFQNFGNILSCKVVASDDGKSKGYGFVQFESENSAISAMEKLNGSTVGGKQMYVGKFVKKSDRVIPSYEAKYTNLYIKNMNIDISEEMLKEKFSQYGKIVSLVISKDENGTSRGFGFVNFENPDDAKRAVEALHGSQFGSKVLYVARAQKKSERMEILRRQFEEKRREQILKHQASNVYVKNVDDNVTEDELREHFSKCGAITSAKLMRDDKGVSKGFGFVCFSTPEEANIAVNTFHGFMLHRKPLYVAIAQRKEERKTQLLLQYSQQHILSSQLVPGAYSPFYYPGPAVVPQIPSQPSFMYQPLGIRPVWRANGFANPSRPAIQPSSVPMASNNPRHHRQYRGRMNPTYALHLQPHSVASSKDSISQQANGMNRSSAAFQPLLIASRPGAEGTDMLSSLLAAAPPKQQKRILGERIFPLVSELNSELASKITGMLLEMDNAELLLLLDSAEALAAKVDEALEVLKLSKPKVTNKESRHSKFLSAEVAVN